MTIDYVMTVKAIITFDEVFDYNALKDKYYPMQTIIKTAKEYIESYDFYSAIVTDAETGEILIEIKNQGEDEKDYLPKYYDDGDTCGYE